MTNRIATALRDIAAKTGNARHALDYQRRHGVLQQQPFLHALKQGFGDNPFFLTPTDTAVLSSLGEFQLGKTLFHNTPIRIDLNDAIRRHTVLLGGSGVGKSTANTLLSLGITQQHPDINVIIFNIRPELNSSLPGFISLKGTELCFNIFERKELPSRFNGAQLADLFATPNYLLYTRTPIATVLAEFYEKGESPSAQQVLNRVRSLGPKGCGVQISQHDKLRSVLSYYCHCVGEKAANANKGFLPEDCNKNMVIEVDFGNQAINSIFISWFIWSIYVSRIAKNQRGKLKTVICVDESKNVISSTREAQNFQFSSTVIEDLVTTVRDAGIGLCIASQSNPPKYMMSNSAMKLLFSNPESSFFFQAAESIGINRHDASFALRTLDVAQAILFLSNFPKPILCHLDYPTFTPEPETVRDTRRREFLKKTNKAAEHPISVDVKADPPKPLNSSSRPSQRAKEQVVFPVPGLVVGSFALLREAAARPISPITVIYKRLGLNSYRGNRAKQHLMDNQLAVEECVQLFQGRGGSSVLLEPTSKGLELLKQHYPDFRPCLLTGKSVSLQHRVHQFLVAQFYRDLGMVVKVEHEGADIAMDDPTTGETWAAEIATEHSRNLESLVSKHRVSGYQKIIVVAPKKLVSRFSRTFTNASDVEVVDVAKYLLPSNSKVGR